MEKYEDLKLENQICFPLYSVSRLITRAYKPYLDTMGLTYPQYLVLLVLWEKDAQTVNEIGKKLLLNTNTLSPLIQRMQKNDLVVRTRSSEDERTVMVSLTSKGLSFKEEAKSIPEDLLGKLLHEDVEVTDVLLLKKTLDSWIEILNNEKEMNINSKK
ncbi:MarR family winged helix-turn-helix transcriptional regulator [Christiangramia portivictoriae]|uniref:MarR family winged helix-turn-helix transcriptional regulator n=1 Tax=Christiangramia portivictoriae TaxID=326069 RepID=UPI000412CB46|nr:MarR family transcriptional regulator [Christiangramia portivictoriae]